MFQFGRNLWDIGSGERTNFFTGSERSEKGVIEYYGYNVNWDVPNELYKPSLYHEVQDAESYTYIKDVR